MMRLVWTFLIVVSVTGMVGAAHASEGQRLALVIGNSSYGEAPLKNPANDARAMAKSLRERGFEVILRENASKKDMETAVADFGEKLTEGATGLFFFAGHGMQVNGRNFLIPIDARITSEQRVRLEALDVDAVLDQMSAAHAKVSMVILDACRNNPFERRFRGFGGGLAQISAPEGTLIAYATAPGKVAADGEGANGLYTQELLKALAVPGLKVEDVFKQVRINVSRTSSGGQVPWEASSLTGDFYFVAPRAAPSGVAAQDASPMIEMAFWDSVKASTNPAEFQAYIDKYPAGNFTPLARARLAALITPQGAPPPATPVAAAVAVAKPVEAPPPNQAPRPQVAALPTAAAPVRSFDGKYTAKVPGSRGTFDSTIEVVGTTIAGFAMSSFGATGLCRVVGSMNRSGTIERMEIDCGIGNALQLSGRFFVDDATGNLTAETYNASQNKSARWEGPNAAAVQRAASVTAYNGKYQSEFRLGVYRITANFEITGVQISGSGYSQKVVSGPATATGGSGSCRIAGTLEPSGKIERLSLICVGIDADLSGTFQPDPASGRVIGHTTAHNVLQGSADVRWERSGS